MSDNPFRDLAQALREGSVAVVRDHSPAMETWDVIKANPLTAISEDDVTITEGEEDVAIDRAILASRPTVGDMVRVHRQTDGGYVIAGVVR